MNTGLALVTNLKLINRDLTDIIDEALAGGIDTVVLREKQLDTGTLYNLASALRDLTNNYGKRLIINDRFDIAMAVGADGVHLGQQSIPPVIVRKILGPDYFIGVSAHNLPEALQAEKDGADYIFLGHIFPSQCKPGVTPKGIKLLQQVSSALAIPVAAIGGLNKNNISDVLRLGIHNIAMMSEILTAQDIRKTVLEIKTIMNNYRP